MANLAEIRTRIKTILEDTGHFQKVFAYEPNRFAQLPAASIFFDGFENSPRVFGTVKPFEIGWRFIIRLYVLLQDAEKAQQEIDTYVSSVITQMNSNADLGGMAFDNRVQSGDVFVSLDKNQPHLMAEINVIVTTHE